MTTISPSLLIATQHLAENKLPMELVKKMDATSGLKHSLEQDDVSFTMQNTMTTVEKKKKREREQYAEPKSLQRMRVEEEIRLRTTAGHQLDQPQPGVSHSPAFSVAELDKHAKVYNEKESIVVKNELRRNNGREEKIQGDREEHSVSANETDVNVHLKKPVVFANAGVKKTTNSDQDVGTKAHEIVAEHERSPEHFPQVVGPSGKRMKWALVPVEDDAEDETCVTEVVKEKAADVVGDGSDIAPQQKTPATMMSAGMDKRGSPALHDHQATTLASQDDHAKPKSYYERLTTDFIPKLLPRSNIPLDRDTQSEAKDFLNLEMGRSPRQSPEMPKELPNNYTCIRAVKNVCLEESNDDSFENRPNGSKKRKKSRLVWTPELHARFVNAVNHLGIEHAVPKVIMQLMNVEGLSRENIASHLQKYRSFLKKGEPMESDSMLATFQKIIPLCLSSPSNSQETGRAAKESTVMTRASAGAQAASFEQMYSPRNFVDTNTSTNQYAPAYSQSDSAQPLPGHAAYALQQQSVGYGHQNYGMHTNDVRKQQRSSYQPGMISYSPHMLAQQQMQQYNYPHLVGGYGYGPTNHQMHMLQGTQYPLHSQFPHSAHMMLPQRYHPQETNSMPQQHQPSSQHYQHHDQMYRMSQMPTHQQSLPTRERPTEKAN